MQATAKQTGTKRVRSDVEELTRALANPFDPADVRWKPGVISGRRALALAYVDARVIQDRLDSVLGVEGWQDDYQCLPDGSVVCRLRLRLGDEWVTKVDVGGPSDQSDGGDRLKAAFSDALKRAAVKFGIGRYLYRLPGQWVDYDPAKRQMATPTNVQAPTLSKRERVASSPPPVNGGRAVPADGAELERRLREYDAKLANRGICQTGDLLAHVMRAGVEAGHGDHMSSWTGPAILLAVEEAKAFETQARVAGVPPAVKEVA